MLAETEINNSAGDSQPSFSNAGQVKEHLNCVHCGQLLISNKDKRAGFCCNGCKAAYEFINNLGLDYFYCLRENSDEWKTNPAPEIKSTYQYFDDSNFKNEFIISEKGSGLSLMEFQISGVHCSACVWILEKLNQVLPGMIEVRVNILTSKAKVRFNYSVLKPSVIAATIESMGYRIQPISSKTGNKIALIGGDKVLATQLGVAGFCAMNVMLLFVGRYQGIFTGIEQHYSNFFAWVSFILAVPSVLYSAQPFYKTSYSALKMKRLHIDLPISIAVLAGFLASSVNTIIGRPEIYFDTVTALVFLLLCGRWCQRKALNYAADLSDTLYTYAPLSALVKKADGRFEEKFTSSVCRGDQVKVGRLEIFPCDGEVLNGKSFVNNSFLSGESRPEEVLVGSKVWAGAVNEGSELLISAYGNIKTSRFGRMLSNIQNAPVSESKTSRFVDRLSKYFVLSVLLLSCGTFVFFIGDGFWLAWDRVIAFLVVSCPCALGIATPVTLSLASAAASRKGILFRSPGALENLSEVKRVFFDKTGTLTSGKLGLSRALLINEAMGWKEVWDVLLTLELDSRQPAGACLFTAAKSNGGCAIKIGDIEQIEGSGIQGTTEDGSVFRIGSSGWLAKCNVDLSHFDPADFGGKDSPAQSLVALAKNDSLMAVFSLSDTLRIEASNVVSKLKFRGMECSILSGDSQIVVEDIEEKLMISPINKNYELLPEEKAEIVSSQEVLTAFVGDGINDALALNKAPVGIAIGGGAEISMKTADVFISKPNLMLVVEAFDGAKKTLALIKRHLAISLLYNVTAGSLAICGLIGPLAAALVMPASSLTVILSSIANVPFRERKS